jgi:thiamine biosynthesis lipoprotein
MVHTSSVFTEEVMGTVVSLDVRGGEPARAVIDDCFAWLQRVDATFSPYRPDTEVCRYDRGEVDDPSPDLRWVLDRCDALARATGGAFDAYATGRLDPSALVKGWAVQRAADALHAAGVRDFCLGAGGDLVVRGAAPWRVGIQHPEDRTALAAVVELRVGAVATSGDYERGAHIVGRGGVRSVTVVGPDLGTADAYSTAAFAMGPGGPRWTARLHGYEAMTILGDGTVLSTPGFPAT